MTTCKVKVTQTKSRKFKHLTLAFLRSYSCLWVIFLSRTSKRHYNIFHTNRKKLDLLKLLKCPEIDWKLVVFTLLPSKWSHLFNFKSINLKFGTHIHINSSDFSDICVFTVFYFFEIVFFNFLIFKHQKDQFDYMIHSTSSYENQLKLF